MEDGTMKSIAALCLTLILLLGVVPAQQAEADNLTMKVKGGWLRLRDEASFSGDTISSYYTGTTVTVLNTKGAWYYVRTPDGKVGYMYGSYLTGSTSSSTGSSQSVTAYVTSSNGKGVRMRSGPGTSYGVIRLYDVGTKVTILTAGTYWHYISVDGQKGYMMADYLTTSYTPSTPSTPSTGDTDYNAYVTSDNGKSVRMRSGAGTGYSTIASYAVGTEVTVLSTTGSWSRISVGGKTGYMMTRYLTTTKPGSSSGSGSTEFVAYTAYVTSENGKSVNLRAMASTNSKVLGQFAVNTSVTVLGQVGSWNRIEVGGMKGYMMSKFLTANQPSGGSGTGADTDTSANYTAYVTSDNGKGVYLRSGAGKSYSSVGFYGVGTQVTVLKHNTTWDYVRIGTREGYMMNQYLTTVVPGTQGVTGVTISNAFPAPGETLWANVTPSGANVTYEWVTDNGLLLATTSTLTLKDDDVGLRIRVRVTGTNGYSGSATSSYATVTSASTTGALTGVTIDNTTPSVGQTLTAALQPNGTSATYRWLRGDGAVVGTAKAYTVQPGDLGFSLWVEATGANGCTGTVLSAKTNPVQAAQASTAMTGTVSLNFSAVLPGVTLNPTVSVNCTQITFHWYVGGAEVSTANKLTVTDDMAGKEIKLIVLPAAGSGYTGQVESNVCTVLTSSVATATDLQ